MAEGSTAGVLLPGRVSASEAMNLSLLPVACCL